MSLPTHDLQRHSSSERLSNSGTHTPLIRTRVCCYQKTWPRVLVCGWKIGGMRAWYTQSLAIGAPYPYFALAGTSTLLTYHAATTHFLYSCWIAIAPPRHCAPIEYNHNSFSARVGRAVASQSARLSSAAERDKREMRSYPPQVLRTTLKQTLVHSPDLNGRPAASRVSITAWRG